MRVRQVDVDRGRDVLDERAAGGDVQHLRAAADGEQRQVGSHRAPREIDLELVASRLGIVDGRVPLLAVEHRIDVAAAGQQQRRRSRPSTLRGLSLTSRTRARPAGLFDRRDVVVEPAAARDADQWVSVMACFLRLLLPFRLILVVLWPTSSPAPCSPSARAPCVSCAR